MSDISKLLGTGSFEGLAQIQVAKAQSAVQQAENLQKGASRSGRRSASEQAELETAATQFESLLLNQMIKSMWTTVPEEGLLSGSREEALYRDMFNQALSDDIAKSQSIGIKDVILRELDEK